MYKGVSLKQEDIREAASRLDAAERSCTQIGLLSERHPDAGMDDAYAIQDEWVRMKQNAGDGQVGWKIGLTSRAMQDALSITTPDSGVLLQSMVFANGSSIPAGRFIQPRVEAELAFVLKAPISADDLSRRAILDATDYVAPALEILDTRVLRRNPETGKIRTVVDTIADNAANGGIVLGDPIHAFSGLDMRWIGAVVSRNGEVEETGLAAGVLGDPVESIRWLVKRLAAYGGQVEAGQVLLSGSFIRPVEAPSGSEICGDFNPYGLVRCRFE